MRFVQQCAWDSKLKVKMKTSTVNSRVRNGDIGEGRRERGDDKNEGDEKEGDEKEGRWMRGAMRGDEKEERGMTREG